MPRAQKEAIHPDLRWEVLERDNFTCIYCGTRKYLAVDHKTPESKGGATAAENLVTACGRCNSIKGTMDFEVYIRAIKGNAGLLDKARLPERRANGTTGSYVKRVGCLTLDEAACFLGRRYRKDDELDLTASYFRSLCRIHGEGLVSRLCFNVDSWGRPFHLVRDKKGDAVRAAKLVYRDKSGHGEWFFKAESLLDVADLSWLTYYWMFEKQKSCCQVRYYFDLAVELHGPGVTSKIPRFC